MGAQRLRTAIAAMGIVGSVFVLSGCGAQVVAPRPSETAAPPSASATPSAEPAPEIEVLFTITANVRAVDGRTVGISMTAHPPIASTDPEAVEIRDEFLAVCGAGNGAQPIDEQYLADQGSTLMLVELSTNTPGQTFVTPLDLFFGSPYFAQSATGDGISAYPGGQTCYSGFLWSTSGDARGVADFENPDGTPDVSQWRFGHYGFTVAPDSGATIEACRVTITEVGQKYNLDEVNGWDSAQVSTGISCGIGYSGE